MAEKQKRGRPKKLLKNKAAKISETIIDDPKDDLCDDDFSNVSKSKNLTVNPENAVKKQ